MSPLCVPFAWPFLRRVCFFMCSPQSPGVSVCSFGDILEVLVSYNDLEGNPQKACKPFVFLGCRYRVSPLPPAVCAPESADHVPIFLHCALLHLHIHNCDITEST